MMTAIKKPFAYLATMLRRLVKRGSAARPIDLSLAKVVIAPGDTLLVTCDRFLAKEQAEQIKATSPHLCPASRSRFCAAVSAPLPSSPEAKGRGLSKVGANLFSDTD
jgi:hypothetical protein